ncbi:MAG: hypothetical protein WCG98_00765 [bacterium]
MAIIHDDIVSIASLQEIQRRKERYQEMLNRKEGKQERVTRCEELEAKCMEYCKAKKYNTGMILY